MNIQYIITREDFLQFQLYTATKSRNTRKNITKSRIRLPIIYLILAIILFFFSSTDTAVILLVIGFLWYFISPVFILKRYKKHYQKHIEEHYKNRFDSSVSLSLEDGYIITKDTHGESKISTSGIVELNEIGSHFFIKISSGESFIIPKRIETIKEIEIKLKKLVKDLNIKHNKELDWKFDL